MKITRKLKVLVGATAIGATTAYLMDPELGRQRRNRLAEAVERRSNDVRHLVRSAERVKEAVTPEPDPETTEQGGEAAASPDTDDAHAESHGEHVDASEPAGAPA